VLLVSRWGSAPTRQRGARGGMRRVPSAGWPPAARPAAGRGDTTRPPDPAADGRPRAIQCAHNQRGAPTARTARRPATGRYCDSRRGPAWTAGRSDQRALRRAQAERDDDQSEDHEAAASKASRPRSDLPTADTDRRRRQAEEQGEAHEQSPRAGQGQVALPRQGAIYEQSRPRSRRDERHASQVTRPGLVLNASRPGDRDDARHAKPEHPAHDREGQQQQDDAGR